MHDLDEVLAKHGYVRLNAKEAKQSNATHQHKSAHDMNERDALTVLVDGDEWAVRDDRGDDYMSGQHGKGAKALDAHLTKCRYGQDE